MFLHKIACLKRVKGTRILGKPNITEYPFPNSSTEATNEPD